MAMIKLLSAGTKVELSKAAIELPLATDLDAAVTAVTAWDDVTCALTGISTEVSEPEQIDTTSLCETYAKTYADGLLDSNTASSDAFFNLKSAEGIALQAAADSKGVHILRVTFTDGSTWASLAKVQPFGFNASVGDTVKTTINFKLQGAPATTTTAA